MRRLLLLLAFVAVVPAARAQYWGENVLEKRFERTDVFFRPQYLNPYGLGGFGAAAAGLIADPLLDARVNPAYLAGDSLDRHYAYLDFRSSRAVVHQQVFPLYADYLRGNAVDVYFPHTYTRPREAPDPVFSAAYLVRPFGTDRHVTIGATYQLVFQDDPYYSIPTDIYRSRVGRSLSGDAMLDAGSIPIVDRYDGTDRMRQRGHFAALHGAVAVTPHLSLGLRLGRTMFDRDGSFGSTNLWPRREGRDSYWSNAEDRTQDYGHWDVSGGVHVRLGTHAVAGVSGGYLWGNARQALARRDSSFSRFGTAPSPPYNRYEHTGRQAQSWDHDGGTAFGSADLSARLGPATRVTVFYRVSREDVDLANASVLSDTSYSTYRSDPRGTYEYRSEYHYAVRDRRSGTGSRTGIRHAFAGTLRWRIDDATRLHVGAHARHDRRRTDTAEDVVAYRHEYQYWENVQQGERTSQQREYLVTEGKELRWDFDARVASLQVPVYLTRRLSDAFELLFGVDRRMASWRITDVTLAVFDERFEVVDGVAERRQDFGERYREPVEERSDVTTSLLLGLTVTPAAPFHIRMMAAPRLAGSYGGTSLDRVDWWIAFNAAL